MTRMVSGIDSVEQHLEQLRADPEVYRPERCPHCGKAGMHQHGQYVRNAPRGEGVAFSLESLVIPRFYCPACQGTCSRLPACLAPRRQYRWATQQAVLERLMGGESRRTVARRKGPGRRTLGRWWQWLQGRFAEHGFHLRSRFAELGRAGDWKGFWSSCFQRRGLGPAMLALERAGVVVP